MPQDNKKYSHYGEFEMGVATDEANEREVPFIILRKAPLKYYKELADDDKTKRDVVWVFDRFNGEWVFVDDWEPDPSEAKEQDILKRVLELNP